MYKIDGVGCLGEIYLTENDDRYVAFGKSNDKFDLVPLHAFTWAKGSNGLIATADRRLLEPLLDKLLISSEDIPVISALFQCLVEIYQARLRMISGEKLKGEPREESQKELTLVNLNLIGLMHKINPDFKPEILFTAFDIYDIVRGYREELSRVLSSRKSSQSSRVFSEPSGNPFSDPVLTEVARLLNREDPQRNFMAWLAMEILLVDAQRYSVRSGKPSELTYGALVRRFGVLNTDTGELALPQSSRSH